jgi:hypothetical protein
MSPEQHPNISPSTDYLRQLADLIYDIRVEQLKTTGFLRQVEEISSQEELDDHFDDLWRVYREVYWELGLEWPPPPCASLD